MKRFLVGLAAALLACAPALSQTLSNPHYIAYPANTTTRLDDALSSVITADSLKAPLASPVFTGDPRCPTPTAGDSDTSCATTAFVASAITTAGGAYQPLDSDLSAIAGLTTTTYGRSLLTTTSGTALMNSLSATDLTTGTLPDARLSNTITAGSVGSASAVPVLTYDAHGRITGVTTAALGSAATANTGTSGATLPFLNGVNTWSGASQSWTGTSFLFGANAGSTVALGINGAAGVSKSLYFRSGNLGRWVVGSDATAEAGANAGATFGIGAYNDAGGFLGYALTIDRATRVATFTFSPVVPTAAALDGSTKVASTAYVDAAVTAATPNIITAAGPIGDASHVPAITYDARGRLTAVTSTLITPSAIGAQPTTTSLTNLLAQGWTAGTQVPTLTAANTWALKTVGAAAGNLLDKSSGDSLYLGLAAQAADSAKLGGTAAAAFALLATPTLTGDPKAPTAAAADNDTSIATTAFTTGAVTTAQALDLKIANNLSDVANAGTARSNLGVAVGVNVQGWDTDLDCLAGLGTMGFLKRTGAGLCAAAALVAGDIPDISATYLTPATAATTYAPLANPTFTGTPAAPTATAGTSTTQLATTAFVATSYAPLASPTLSGDPKAPTATAGDSDTSVATTGFTTGAIATAQALDEKLANKGAASGYAGLDGSSKVSIANLPTGTTSTTVAIGNDSRITGAVQGATTATLTTTDATATSLLIPATPSGSVAVVDGIVTARNTSTGDVAAWSFRYVIKNVAGTQSLLGTAAITALGADSGASTWVAAMFGVRIRVTGVAATTIHWSFDGRIVSVQ